MSPNSLGQHLLQAPRKREGRAPRRSEKEREGIGGGGAQVDRGPGLRVQGLCWGECGARPTRILKGPGKWGLPVETPRDTLSEWGYSD